VAESRAGRQKRSDVGFGGGVAGPRRTWVCLAVLGAAVARVGRFRTRWVVALAAGDILGAGMVAAPPLGASVTGAVGIAPQVTTPLVATPLASPHSVVGADGRVHLA
jgi:hypothetical protein